MVIAYCGFFSPGIYACTPIETGMFPVYRATADALSAVEDRPVVGGNVVLLALWRALLIRVNLFLLHRCSDRSIVLN